MSKPNFLPLALTGLLLLTSSSALAQKQKVIPPTPPKLVRTTTRNETSRLGYGGTVTIVGAPEGSITVEGWSRNEVEVRAEIQLRADSEKDLDQLAAVNGFILDQDLNHVRVLTTGMHDRAFMKKQAKNFPKTLLSLPWRIDYRIRVPLATDLDINGGRGPISVAGIEGNIHLSAPQSEMHLQLASGTLSTTIAAGGVTLKVNEKSWRRGNVEIAVAAGGINLELPAGFSGDLDADILRSGQIEIQYDGFEAREKPGITSQHVRARVGSGGGFMKLTVGDGRIFISKQQTANSKQ